MWLTAAAAGRPIPAEKLQIKREGVCSVQRVRVCHNPRDLFCWSLFYYYYYQNSHCHCLIARVSDERPAKPARERQRQRQREKQERCVCRGELELSKGKPRSKPYEYLTESSSPHPTENNFFVRNHTSYLLRGV